MVVAITPGCRADFEEIVAVWEASVRATHRFVSESDIRFFKPLLRDRYLNAVTLHCARDDRNTILGFCGVLETKIEMLFVSPVDFGKGIGRLLLSHAIHKLGATDVDVNEQNHEAVGFYAHHGFAIFGRSPVDGTGKPYPLLHMRLRSGPAGP
jgi:putative acetyltransferase